MTMGYDGRLGGGREIRVFAKLSVSTVEVAIEVVVAEVHHQLIHEINVADQIIGRNNHSEERKSQN